MFNRSTLIISFDSVTGAYSAAHVRSVFYMPRQLFAYVRLLPSQPGLSRIEISQQSTAVCGR